ncbi:MAG: type II toxin-antitoxin system PemK/MazF family toxin [Chloroflexota bacterium]
MATLLSRGAIVWAELDPVRGHEQGGRRPVLIISNDVINVRSGTVITLAITSQPQRAPYPLTFRLANGTLPRESWVKLAQIRTLATERLGPPLGTASPADVDQIVAGVDQLIR